MKTEVPQSATDFEKTDASPRVVAATAGALALIVGLCLGLAAWVYHHPEWDEGAVSTLAPDGRFQNGAGELTGIEQAWREQDRVVQEHLDTYGWVDRAAVVVHIPVNRAIDLMLAEGEAARAGTTQTKSAR
jgi:hypothetical protein